MNRFSKGGELRKYVDLRVGCPALPGVESRQGKKRIKWEAVRT